MNSLKKLKMPEMQPYEYAIIRLVPRVEREEFLNVGIILYSKDQKFLGVRIRLDESRTRAFAPDLDLEEVRSYLKTWEWICEGNPKGGPIATLDLPGRFRWLTAVRSTIIQPSRLHPGMCLDPERTLEALFQKYV